MRKNHEKTGPVLTMSHPLSNDELLSIARGSPSYFERRLATATLTVLGEYEPMGRCYGKKVFCKRSSPEIDIRMYFWNNKPMQGWWIGHRVGGEQVWARNCDTQSIRPPKGGWRIPWNGEICKGLRLLITGQMKPDGSRC